MLAIATPYVPKETPGRSVSKLETLPAAATGSLGAATYWYLLIFYYRLLPAALSLSVWRERERVAGRECRVDTLVRYALLDVRIDSLTILSLVVTCSILDP